MPRHRHAGVGAEPAAGGSPARGLGWLGTLGPTRRGSALAAASGPHPHHGLWPTLPLGRVGRDQGGGWASGGGREKEILACSR
jgi:hypothetical protein